jgi:thiosulfate dehydrogenase (quinone) large subunit
MSTESAVPAAAPAPAPTTAPADMGRTFAFLVLRAWLGVRALMTGIDKYSGTRMEQLPLLDANGDPDPSGAMVEVPQKFYAWSNYQAMPDTLQTQLAGEPLIPGFLAAPFYAVLGPVLILLGLALLVGVFNRITLFAMGLLYTALSVGLILLKQDGGVAWLGIHVAMVAMALMLVSHNRFAVTRA